MVKLWKYILVSNCAKQWQAWKSLKTWDPWKAERLFKSVQIKHKGDKSAQFLGYSMTFFSVAIGAVLRRLQPAKACYTDVLDTHGDLGLVSSKIWTRV